MPNFNGKRKRVEAYPGVVSATGKRGLWRMGDENDPNPNTQFCWVEFPGCHKWVRMRGRDVQLIFEESSGAAVSEPAHASTAAESKEVEQRNDAAAAKAALSPPSASGSQVQNQVAKSVTSGMLHVTACSVLQASRGKALRNNRT